MLPQSVSTSSTAAARGQDLAAFGRQQHRKSLSDERQKEQRGWEAPFGAKAQGGEEGGKKQGVFSAERCLLEESGLS